MRCPAREARSLRPAPQLTLGAGAEQMDGAPPARGPPVPSRWLVQIRASCGGLGGEGTPLSMTMRGGAYKGAAISVLLAGVNYRRRGGAEGRRGGRAAGPSWAAQGCAEPGEAQRLRRRGSGTTRQRPLPAPPPTVCSLPPQSGNTQSGPPGRLLAPHGPSSPGKGCQLHAPFIT
jgi:hypothetical protein